MKAYIIGTGPGNEELLTLKAVKALKECTAVLYDRLVSSNILNYLNEDCEIYYCGKEPGSHYKTQEEINEMLVTLAKRGHTVGRVKGGDPYVFGRGGEEVLSLIEENIEFEVIPGVTSPVAVLSYGGIPITHRGVAQDFHIITGMSKGQENVNYKALAMETGTLVFMMGLGNLNKIVENLIKNGKNKETKSAVVMRGGSSKQRKVIGTLEDIEEKVIAAKLKSPCIIVVGEVVKFAEEFSWYEKKPLFGHNICITRSKEQAGNLRNKLYDLGAEVTEINSIRIQDTSYKLDDYINKIGDYENIIFTSTNGVNKFFDYLIKKEYDIRNIKGRISAIGKSTENALKSRGIIPMLTAKEFNQEGLIEDLRTSILKGEKVLLPTSSKSRPYLKENLDKLGLIVDKVDIYDTICGKVSDFRGFEEVDVVFYTSPSTVYNMIEMLGLDNILSKRAIAIGPETMKALKDNKIEGIMLSKHSEKSFLEEIVTILKKDV